MLKIILTSLIIFGNEWIWRIAHYDFIIFISLIITTTTFYILINHTLSLKLLVFLFLFLGVLFLKQILTTNYESLTLLSNDEQRIQSTRLQFYNSSRYSRVLFNRLNLKEVTDGTIGTIITRLQRNLFEALDPNVYFFGGHPRERVWANDFEKFPFILIVPFLIGLYETINQRKWIILLYFTLSLLLLSFIGHKNILGPFILFPIIVNCILIGIKHLKLIR